MRRITNRDEAARALSAAAGSALRDDAAAAILDRPDVHVLAAYAGDEPAGTFLAYELPRLLRTGTGMLLYSIDVAAARPLRRRVRGLRLSRTSPASADGRTGRNPAKA